MAAHALLVAGTASDAGKSTIVTGICRYLYRQGVRVAPYKAQNMSNNSVVVEAPGTGAGEIGRAQALQAAACGLAPSVAFNPVLLKPGGDMRSQVVLHGTLAGDVGAGDYAAWRPRLTEAAFDGLDALRREFDVVICEGAGSPAEINLRDGDFVNMGLARHGRMPVLIAADIDRGGAFAAVHGTLALLPPADQELVAGYVINRFRGDAAMLRPGLDMMREMTGRPAYGVLPWHPGVRLDGEDSLAYADGQLIGHPEPPAGGRWLRVAAVRLPHISNATDLEAIAAEPGVAVRMTTSVAEVATADLVVLPGSKATVEDLAWLRETGLADAITAHAAAGGAILGICGGFQMLARTIRDEVESARGLVGALGLLPVDITFAAAKTLAQVSGTVAGRDDVPVRGYEIHHGYVSGAAPDRTAMFRADGGLPEGAVSGRVYGTHWHGAFESDEFRRAFLGGIVPGFTVATGTVFHARRERVIELLADLVEAHMDTTALIRLIEGGAPPGLPFVPPGGPGGR